MNESLAPPVASPSAQPLDLRWLAACAVVLPAAIAAVDYAILARTSYARNSALGICMQSCWFIVQVGLVGYVVGRGVAQPLLRWVVFGWVLLLVNLLTATLAMTTGLSWHVYLPPAALLAGQIGLCVVWAFLGSTHWQVRWPTTVPIAFGIIALWLALGTSSLREMWTELLVLQVITLAVLCGLLRLRGYQLERMQAGQADPAADRAQRRLQFGIKHVLIWTAALATLLGLGKALDLLTWQAAQELVRGGMAWKLTLATTSAIVIVVALWVALGCGHWLARLAVGVLFALAAGSGLAFWSVRNAAALHARLMVARGWNRRDWELLAWYDVGWGWLVWLFLSGGLLAATLIILRTLDYRLVRKRRPSKP